MTACPATFYTIAGAGQDVWWRSQAPAKAIGAKLCLIRADQEQQCFKAPTAAQPFPWWPVAPFRWRVGSDGCFDHPDHQGPTAVWTRPCTRRTLHALAMQERGILTVAEVDDNYLDGFDWNVNIFMRQNDYGAKDRLAHLHSFSLFDRIVFATDWLRDTYAHALREETGRVPDLRVCRNHVDLDDWPTPTVHDGRVRVGWMGSPQHARDIKLAYPALAWARENGCDVVFIGHDVRDETGVFKQRAIQVCRAWRDVITTHIPWIDPAEYHRTGLPLDVCVVPLERNQHTLGKSDIKALEAWMSGAAVVASRATVYDQAVTHGERGFLAGDSEGRHMAYEFLHYVKELVRNPRLREETVQAGQEYVREQRSLQNVGKHEWLAAVTP